MLALFSSNSKQERAARVREIHADLTGRWDLSRSYSLPGEGAANLLVEALNTMFGRLRTFVHDLTRRNVEMATVAPQTHAIAGKIKASSASLTHRAEQIEATCRGLADGIGHSALSAGRALEQSGLIVQEIDRTCTLTDQAVARTHAMEQDVHRLTGAIAELERKSRDIGSIIESISDIADNTGLLSLNAFIEAARAGAHGAGFGVIAQEIRQLSQETARAALEVKESLSAISGLIHETVAAVSRVGEGVASGVAGNREASAALEQVNGKHRRFHAHLEGVIDAVREQEQAVARFAGDLSQITAIGREGQKDSATLAQLAETVKLLTEEQLLATGMFILPQYRRAEAVVAAMAGDPAVSEPGPRTDEALQRLIRPHAFLELVYLTDNHGLQVSSNVFKSGQTTRCDASALGRNWSQKEWFRKVRETGKAYISNIYKSEATDAFCLTISIPVYSQGAWVGVLGADISFEDLLAI